MKYCGTNGVPNCHGFGYHDIPAVETHATHQDRKNDKTRLTSKRVTFRAPCRCHLGLAFIERVRRGIA